MHTQNKGEWERAVLTLGAIIEPDGSGRLVAHIDGNEIGHWDPKYAGVGIGTVVFEYSLTYNQAPHSKEQQ